MKRDGPDGHSVSLYMQNLVLSVAISVFGRELNLNSRE